jgi:integrase/recombinase XerD
MEENQKQLAAFESHMILKNFSKATRSSYGCALRQFFDYRGKQGITGDFTQEQARSYLLHRYGRGLKWQTINGDYSAMYKLYREVLGLDWDVRHIPRPMKERPLPRLLSVETVQKLIESGSSFKHQVFMTLLYGTGLRISEALHLRLGDIDGQRLQIHVVKGKGSKDRYVEMPACLLTLLRQYYLSYRPEVYLFNGKTGGQPWAVRTAQWAIKNARKRAGISQEATAHVFRHCYATHHLESGTNLVFLKEQMGHNDLKTTSKYIRLCKPYYRQVEHPIAGMDITYHRGIQ